LPKRPSDVNQLAKSVIDEATREEDPAGVLLGGLGGLKGGKARAENLFSTREKRLLRKRLRQKLFKIRYLDIPSTNH
jgi:hypothetical protein